MSLLSPLIQDDRGAWVSAVVERRALVRAAVIGAGGSVGVLTAVAVMWNVWSLFLLLTLWPILVSALAVARNDPCKRLAASKKTGVCPACMYRLEKLPIEGDGCTLCPECGAAWRLPAEPSPRSPRAPR